MVEMVETEHPGMEALEAAAFRRLITHLRQRQDVSNIDLMASGGFCRNCLSNWYQEAAAERGIALTKDAAREVVYGMPYAEWKARHGAGFIVQREKYMTNVYNHFALPPTMGEFCKAALAMSRDEKLIKVGELDAFSARSLPNIEIVYDDFFRRYAQYRTDLAEWTAKYGALTTQ